MRVLVVSVGDRTSTCSRRDLSRALGVREGRVRVDLKGRCGGIGWLHRGLVGLVAPSVLAI